MEAVNHTLQELAAEFKTLSVGGQIDPFSGEDPTTFKSFEKAVKRAAMQVNDAQAKNIVIRALRGPAADYCMELLDDDATKELTYKQLLQHLRERFLTGAEQPTARHQLKTLRQWKN